MQDHRNFKTPSDTFREGAKSYKHIFIDLDDTIWDFHANARLSLKEIYENRNLNRLFDDFEHFFYAVYYACTLGY